MFKETFSGIVIAFLMGIFLFFRTLPERRTLSTEYFVSETGSNSNSGRNASAPLKTIGEAVKRMKVGDQCWVLEGTYRESVTITKSNISIASYKGARVVVSGLDVVKGWKKEPGKIYRTSFVPEEKDLTESAWHLNGRGKYFLDVMVNGKPMNLARYPNLKGNISTWNEHGGEIKVLLNGRATFSGGDRKNWPANYWRGGIFHGIVEKKFNAVQGIIVGHGADEVVCEPLTSGWKKSTKQRFAEYIFSDIENEISGIGRGFIANHFNALDVEGEWYWDKKNNILYIIPPVGIDAKQMVVEAKSRKSAFLISNCTGVRIEGIQIQSAGLEIDNASQCIIDHCSITYPVPFYIHLDEYNGKANVTVLGNENSIRNSYVGHSWGSGIEIVGGRGNVIENTLVEDVDWMGTYNACVRVGGLETKVVRNTLRQSGRFLIQGTGIKKGLITHNDLYNGMTLGQDGGAFYTYVQDGAGTEIAFNWVHGLKGVAWERSEHDDHNITVGIYLDGGCKNFNVHHNIIWGAKYGIMYNATEGADGHASVGNTMNYNTCFVSGQSAIVSKHLPELYQNNEASHNLSNKKIVPIAAKEGNMIDENLSAQLTKGDYQSRKTGRKQSPNAINAGAYAATAPWLAGADTSLIRKIR